MQRIKIGLVVSGMLAIMALSAAPAFALFEAEKQLQGQIPNSEIKNGGEFVYEKSATVKCPTKSPTIDWVMQSKSSSVQQYKIVWGKECKALIGGNELAAEIKPSRLEVKSPESGKAAYTELKGTNLEATEIKTSACTIIVPAEGNKELKKTEQKSPSLTSFEESVLVNTTGIHAEKTKNALCPLLASTSSAELKGVEFNLKGQGQR